MYSYFYTKLGLHAQHECMHLDLHDWIRTEQKVRGSIPEVSVAGRTMKPGSFMPAFLTANQQTLSWPRTCGQTSIW